MEIEHIIALGENEKIEFKESFSKEVVISLVSFANFHGGTVYVGITNNGEVKGVSINQETVQQYIKRSHYKSRLRQIRILGNNE
jgi:ATP-dependent DNA helicase RecG